MNDWDAVAVIAAYLTFFPVTVNTIRGLQSADPRALELMHSYAASGWTILWKLRFPASLPYLFSALKIAATASVVGAIIGELPSSIQDGLGGAILNFNQYYSLEPQEPLGDEPHRRAARHRVLPRGRRSSSSSSSDGRRSTSHERRPSSSRPRPVEDLRQGRRHRARGHRPRRRARASSSR